MLVALFGTCEWDAIQRHRLHSATASAFSAVLAPGFAGLRFNPGLIDPKLVTETQRATCFAMVEAWRHSTCIDVLVVDLHAITYADVGRIMADASIVDVHTGLDLWLTMPANFKRIVVIEPSGLVGWAALAKIGTSLLSAKLRDRLHFVRSEEEAAALWQRHDPGTASAPTLPARMCDAPGSNGTCDLVFSEHRELEACTKAVSSSAHANREEAILLTETSHRVD
jgi:hypothetical protein